MTGYEAFREGRWSLNGNGAWLVPNMPLRITRTDVSPKPRPESLTLTEADALAFAAWWASWYQKPTAADLARWRQEAGR